MGNVAFRHTHRTQQGLGLGLYRDTGKEHGNYYNGLIYSVKGLLDALYGDTL